MNRETMKKRIRKKQLRRATARQCGEGVKCQEVQIKHGSDQRLPSSADHKRPITERWGGYAEAMITLGIEPDFRH